MVNKLATNKYKTVAIPINVPKVNYCWDMVNDAICGHFDNEHGVPSCGLNIGILEYKTDKIGYKKPTKCKILKEV